MNEISKKLKCAVMRNGVEIWKEDKRLEDLGNQLVSNQKIGFIKIDDEIINSADIVGIFTPQTMEEMTHRKNGQWKCKYNNWHEKFKKCECYINEMTGEQKAKYSQG